jgi:NTE family protein
MARRDVALLLAASLALAGCATTIFTSSGAPADTPAIDPPRFEAPPASAPKPRVALVLSGGAARAFAHLGVLRVLEREGLRPDLVVGTSAGAIVGACYAAGLPVAEIEVLAARIDWPTLIDIDPVKTLLGGFGLGLAKGERLEAFLRRSVGLPLERMPIPFVAVATDLHNGEAVLLNHGDTPRALRASSAVPALYEPVRAAGSLLGDGQIVSPMPVAAARRLGAQVVIAVDVVYPPQHAPLTNPMSVLFQSVTISTYRHLLNERAQADLLIAPDIPPTGDLALGDREWLIKAGQRAAEAQLGPLRAAFRRP